MSFGVKGLKLGFSYWSNEPIREVALRSGRNRVPQEKRPKVKRRKEGDPNEESKV
jgi:hypothetical protein